MFETMVLIKLCNNIIDLHKHNIYQTILHNDLIGSPVFGFPRFLQLLSRDRHPGISYKYTALLISFSNVSPNFHTTSLLWSPNDPQ